MSEENRMKVVNVCIPIEHLPFDCWSISSIILFLREVKDLSSLLLTVKGLREYLEYNPYNTRNIKHTKRYTYIVLSKESNKSIITNLVLEKDVYVREKDKKFKIHVNPLKAQKSLDLLLDVFTALVTLEFQVDSKSLDLRVDEKRTLENLRIVIGYEVLLNLHAPRIKYLKIRFRYSDSKFPTLQNMDNVTTLCLDSCDPLVINQGLTVLPNIRKLILRNCEFNEFSEYEKCIIEHPNLKIFEFDLFERISNAYFFNFPTLEEFNNEFSSFLKPSIFGKKNKYFPYSTLKKARLGSHQLVQKELKKVGEKIQEFSKCKVLEYLEIYLMISKEVSECEIATQIHDMESLRFLDISFGTKVTDVSFCLKLQNLPKLDTVDIRNVIKLEMKISGNVKKMRKFILSKIFDLDIQCTKENLLNMNDLIFNSFNSMHPRNTINFLLFSSNIESITLFNSQRILFFLFAEKNLSSIFKNLRNIEFNEKYPIIRYFEDLDFEDFDPNKIEKTPSLSEIVITNHQYLEEIYCAGNVPKRISMNPNLQKIIISPTSKSYPHSRIENNVSLKLILVHSFKGKGTFSLENLPKLGGVFAYHGKEEVKVVFPVEKNVFLQSVTGRKNKSINICSNKFQFLPPEE